MNSHANLFSQAFVHLENKQFGAAEQIFIELYKEGNVHAQINLATLYLDPRSELRNPAKAFDLLMDAVEKEDGISAANNLGMMYMSGLFVEQNYQTAHHWLTKGADAKIPACMVNLGRLFMFNMYSSPKYETAIDYFVQSYAHGYEGGIDEIRNVLTMLNNSKTPEIYLEELAYHINYLFSDKYQNLLSSPMGELETALGNMFDKVEGPYSYIEHTIKWYTIAHQKGSVQATNNIGAIYLKGEHGTSNEHEAFKYFMEAANKNFSFAMKNVGCCYLDGLGTDKDLNAAASWLSKSVGLGCLEAVPSLAYTLHLLEPDNTLSYLSLLQQACDMNHPLCLFILGRIYLKGLGVEANTSKGVTLLKQASNLKIANASFLLGLHYLEDHLKDAATYFLKSLEQSKYKTEYLSTVSEIFYDFADRQEIDNKEVFRLNKMLADQGNAAAQNRLALLYLHGKIVAKDIKLAYEYSKLSAEQNNPDGLFAMANALSTSSAVKLNNIEDVLSLLEQAAELGSPKAEFALGLLYYSGIHMTQDKQIGMEYISRAANKGFGPAIEAMRKLPKN